MLLQKVNLVRMKNKIKNILWKKNEEKTREYELNYDRNLSEKEKEKKSMEEIVIKFSSNDEKRKTQRICIKITVKN